MEDRHLTSPLKRAPFSQFVVGRLETKDVGNFVNETLRLREKMGQLALHSVIVRGGEVAVMFKVGQASPASPELAGFGVLHPNDALAEIVADDDLPEVKSYLERYMRGEDGEWSAEDDNDLVRLPKTNRPQFAPPDRDY